jgi:hypothetical protein
MSLTRCPFCEHGNPADSKFCSECGGALHLVPCPHCGAVSEVTATVCYQCSGPLPGRTTDTLVASSPAAEVSGSLPRRPSRAIVGTAVLAAIAVLGYYSYRQRLPAEVPQPPAASSEASARGAPAGAGVIGRDAAAGDTTPATVDDSARLTRPATSPSGIPLADPAPAAANHPRAGRQPVESQEAETAAEPIARPQAIDASRAGGRGSFRPEACTEAVAARGLCALKPVQKKEEETAAAVEAAIKRPQTTDAGKASGQEPPLPQTCTEAVAALGLCTPKTTQRGE